MNEKKYLTAQEAAQLSESYTRINLPKALYSIEMNARAGEHRVIVFGLNEDEIDTLKSLGFKVTNLRKTPHPSFGFLIEW